MVVRVVAVVRDGVDVLESECFRHFLRRVQDEVLRTVGMAALCNLLDDVLGILHVRPLHGADPERPLARFVRRDPEHHLIEVRIIEAQHNRQKPFLALAGTISELKAEMTGFIMAFPENVRRLAIEANDYILLEMLCQIVHMLLHKLGTLIECRLIVEESARRLLVDKWILLSHLGKKRIARKELVQPLHLRVMAETPCHEDDEALHAA